MNLGGKANQLLQLQAWGYNVPAFEVVSAESQPEIWTDSELDLFWNKFSGDAALFAVRSSANIEDGNTRSFAGLFHSELCVPKINILTAIQKVRESAHTKRVETYLNATDEKIDMHVVVQEMIQPDVSGVAFGVNPINGNPNQIIINSIYGLGEALVDGSLSADQFVWESGKLTETIVEKTATCLFDTENGAGTTFVKLTGAKCWRPSLGQSDLVEIRETVLALNEKYQHPVDMEFCYADGKLYVLQCRPVTTIVEQPIIFDNSNIIESYPGLTAPLTFSFIERMYAGVYQELSRIFGLRKHKIESNAAIYENMLGLIKGRVYYNLNSWYAALALLPMYSVNAPAMEKMMGVKESFPYKPKATSTKWKGIFDTVLALVKMIVAFIRLPANTRKFQSYLERVLTRYHAIDVDRMNAHELLEAQNNFEKKLLNKWKPPLVNDFFAMMVFSAFQKFVEKQFGEANLHNDLLSGAGNILTTEPITLNIEISELILNNPEAKDLFENHSGIYILNQLMHPKFQLISSKINAFLYKWGNRCVGELKLETKTYIERPEDYIAILQNYVKQKISSTNFAHHLPGSAKKENQDQIYTKRLSLFKRPVFRFLLSWSRYLISNRESLRYERTRAYGVVRRIYRAMGKYFASRGALSSAEDIFYLKQAEISAYILGKEAWQEIDALVAERKIAYAEYKQEDLPERIQTFGIPYLNLPTEGLTKAEIPLTNQLTGIACCNGIVRAPVCVLRHPDEADGLNGHILVTSSTDPGWVSLFPSASGILVERGSLLSHSAIVSREMGIPCIVGIKDLLKTLKTGDWVEMNGATGQIKIEKYDRATA